MRHSQASFLTRLLGTRALFAVQETAPQPASQAEAKQYAKEKFQVTVVSMVTSFVYMGIMAFAGGHWLAHLVAPIADGNRWIELFGVAGLFFLGAELIGLPLSFYSGYVIEHRYKLSNQTVGAWVVKQLKMLALGVGIGTPVLAGLYAILWNFPGQWWLFASGGMLFLSVVLGQLAPVLIVPLFYKVKPLEDEVLIARLRAIAEEGGLKIKDVTRLGLSKETKKANAMLTGMGATKRVMLGDTLVDGFTHDEIATVFGHEVGHSVHGHIVKGIIGSTVVTLLSFFVVDLVCKTGAVALGHASFSAASALPLFMFALSVFSFFVGPIEKAVSRHFERQSDWYALEHTNNVPAYKAAFSRLAEMNKAELAPSRLKVLLFYTHPPISERLAMADRWLAERQRA